MSALDTPSAEFKAIFDHKASMTALIGHTRAATRGSIKTSNAHPFIFPRVIGVHNGTINTDLVYEKEYETDSEALYRDINERGLLPALKEINKGYPNYALVMFDRARNKLVAIRNARRPFHFTFNKASNTMFFSSEAGALRYVLGRHNVTYSEQVFPLLKEDVALEMPLTYDILADMEFKQVDVKHPVLVYSSTGSTGTGNSHVWPGHRVVGKSAAAPAVTVAATARQDKPTLPSVSVSVSKPAAGSYEAPEGMSKSQRKKFTKALKKQARISAMLAKQEEEEEAESTGFTEASTPSFLKGAGIKATTKRIRKFFKTTPITEDGKSAVLHQSALFDDIDDVDIALDVLNKGPLKPDDKPFDDPLPWEDDPVDPAEDDVEIESYKGAYSESVSRAELEDILARGCQWCGQAEHIEFHERVEWVDRTSYVCGECMETNEDVMMYFGRKPKAVALN